MSLTSQLCAAATGDLHVSLEEQVLLEFAHILDGIADLRDKEAALRAAVSLAHLDGQIQADELALLGVYRTYLKVSEEAASAIIQQIGEATKSSTLSMFDTTQQTRLINELSSLALADGEVKQDEFALIRLAALLPAGQRIVTQLVMYAAENLARASGEVSPAEQLMLGVYKTHC